MAIDTRTALKAYFQTGDTPTQAQFENLIDSFWHKADDTLVVDWASVSGKPATFAPAAHSHAWTDITGRPSTFAPAAHVHSAGEITTGVFHPARLGAGVTTDGLMIQIVAGVPTWVTAPSGGGGGSPAGSSGQIQFNNGGAFAATSLFFWDNSNNRLGIGSSSPAYSLDVNGTARVVTVPTITTATKMLVKDPTTGQISEQLLPSGGGVDWTVGGNAITTPSTQYLGTTTNQEMWVKTGTAGMLRVAFGVAAPTAVPALGTMGGASMYINSGDSTSANYGAIFGVNQGSGASYIQAQALTSATAYPLLLQPKGGAVRINTEADFKGFNASLYTRGLFGISSTFDANNGVSIDAGAGVGYVDMQTWGQVMTINGRGNNVGIGTFFPSAQLHVAGSVRFAASGVNYFEMDAAGKLFLRNAPIFASDAAASSLAADTIYKTATGELRIKL